MKHIMKCKKCGYTMKEKCCGEKTIDSKPPKYSPDDKYGRFRREVKEKERKDKDLI